MRLLISFVVSLLMSGCAYHRAAVSTYSTDATFTGKQEDGSYELLVRVSRLSERHGSVSEELVGAPRLRIVPGVPVPARPVYAAGSLPFAVISTGVRGAEEDVNVDVAWEGAQGTAPVCRVTVMLQGRVVSRTKMALSPVE